MEYLKDKQHYIDRYDLNTIIECLSMIDVYRHAYVDSLKTIGKDQPAKAEIARASSWLANQNLFVIKANRYVAKDETIQKWIDRDQMKQEKIDNTPAPSNIRCLNCKKLMSVKSKHLEFSDDPLRVLFFFECKSCKKRRAIYDDGKEFSSKPLCSKCKAEIEVTLIKESTNEVVWKKSCSSCGFNETEVDNFKKMRAEHKKFEAENKEKEDQEKQALVSYRDEYCSEEKGKEAYEYMEAIKVAEVVFDEEVKKYDSLAYQKVTQLKKLSVTDLQKQLEKIFEKEKYINLSFGNPEINQHVVLPFNIQEGDTSRKQEISVSRLQEIIKDALEGTNWRLMTEGISYRLGYMSGRLKGYEREEDFLELYGKKEEEPSKIDYETRMLYEGHSTVQLAHIFGEHKGIDNVRQRRLKQDPEGFFLEENEGPYECAICQEWTPGNRVWWTPECMRCADCWRNIKEGVIPPLDWAHNGNIWMEEWYFSSDMFFGINASTVGKLKRQGLLHGRELKREDGTIYCTVYIVDENKEFLKKYPKKIRPVRVMTDLLGEKIEIF